MSEVTFAFLLGFGWGMLVGGMIVLFVQYNYRRWERRYLERLFSAPPPKVVPRNTEHDGNTNDES